MEIHIQPVLPSPQLLVYGASPIARALARLGKAMGYRVFAVDPSADEASFPGVDARLTDPRQVSVDPTSAPVFAVVATQGEWDEPALLAALAHAPAYVSVVASPRRFAEMRAQLADRASEADLAGIKNPAGLDLGSRVPEEIALGILAEIVKEHRQKEHRDDQPGSATRDRQGDRRQPSQQVEERSGERALPSSVKRLAVAPEARDPVCGMTVHNPAAAPRAEHLGKTYFFCCLGCQMRFSGAPERYVEAS